MSDIPVDAPAQCPGASSDLAGKSGACEGCPNQTACSSGWAKLPLNEREPETVVSIRHRLNHVRYRILVLSGKGGVGKSSLAVCLARGLSRYGRHVSTSSGNGCHDGCSVGLLDLDLCGPSTPCMLGCLEEKVHQSQSGWSPVYVSDKLALMSVGFMLPSVDHAVIWRGSRKNSLIRQLLTDVCWTTGTEEPMDFLLIDTPPGTSDEHLSVIQYLQAANCLDGALIITTPQEVSLSDVRKEITFCQKLSVPILGIIENMSEFTCPSCGYTSAVFPPTTGGADSLVRLNPLGNETVLLGRLPLDPRLARALDEGICPFELAELNDSLPIGNSTTATTTNTLRSTDPVILAYMQLMERLWDRLNKICGSADRQIGQRMDLETGELQC